MLPFLQRVSLHVPETRGALRGGGSNDTRLKTEQCSENLTFFSVIFHGTEKIVNFSSMILVETTFRSSFPEFTLLKYTGILTVFSK